MISAFSLIGGLAILELLLGGLLSLALFYPLRKTTWDNGVRRTLFIIFGAVLVTPALAPAGSAALIPLPLGVVLAFVRTTPDIAFLAKTSWFTAPSLLITGFFFGYIARWLFPNQQQLQPPGT